MNAGHPLKTCTLCSWLASGCDGSCRMPAPAAPPPPKGCICPPTSEQTCQRWDCGRKSPNLKVT